MKLFFKRIFYLLVLFSFEHGAYSLSDYQIKEICQKKPRKSSCIKNLKFKKSKLIQGDQIEIPVIPFKR